MEWTNAWNGVRSWIVSADQVGMFSTACMFLIVALLLTLWLAPASAWRRWGRISAKLVHYLALREVLQSVRKAARADVNVLVGILGSVRYFFTLEGQRSFWIDGVLEILAGVLFFAIIVGGIEFFESGFDFNKAVAQVASSGAFILVVTALLYAGIWVFRRVYAFLTWDGSDWDEWKETVNRKLSS